MMGSARKRDRDKTDTHTQQGRTRNRIPDKPPPLGLLSRAAGGDYDYSERLQSCEQETFSITEAFQALATFDQVC